MRLFWQFFPRKPSTLIHCSHKSPRFLLVVLSTKYSLCCCFCGCPYSSAKFYRASLCSGGLCPVIPCSNNQNIVSNIYVFVNFFSKVWAKSVEYHKKKVSTRFHVQQKLYPEIFLHIEYVVSSNLRQLWPVMTIIFRKLLFHPLLSLFSYSRLPGNSNDILKEIAL